MTDYVKLVTRAVASENSDYSEPYLDTKAYGLELSGITKIARLDVGTSTSADLVTMDAFTTIEAVVARNKSTTSGEEIHLMWAVLGGTRAPEIWFLRADRQIR